MLRSVGREQILDIELKYPNHVDSSIGSGAGSRPWPRPAYLARVLADLQRHCTAVQPAFLSSFEWKLCALAAAAQAPGPSRRFPIMVLTEAGTHEEREPEQRSLFAACEFAVVWGLEGVVSHCQPLLDFPELAQWVRGLGLRLATFGGKNNRADLVRR